MPTTKKSAKQAEEPSARIYRIPQEQWKIIDEVIHSNPPEETSRELNMLLIAGISNSLYDCGIDRQQVTILIYNLIRLVEATCYVFDNGYNELGEEFEDVS